MLNRSAVLCVAGAAIFALDASAASAQDTTRTRPTSSQRIRVGKEQVSSGEVTTRVDSVTVYRTDTLRLPGRVDTVTTTNTITRVDTVTKTIPLTLPDIGGLYLGLGGGATLPAAMFNDSDHPGWRLEGQLGIDPIGTPFGIRINAGYSRYEPHSWVAPLLDMAQTWNVDGDVKLRLATMTPHLMRAQFYVLGGASYNRFRDVLETNHGVLSIGDNVGGDGVLPTTPDHSWHSGWGYNAGAGVALGHGRTSVFLESRFARFKGENSNISNVPIVLGLSWY